MPALVKVEQGQGKVTFFGLEVTDNITWQGWEPGKEYTKVIVLKNVKLKTEKLQYKSPETRFFHTLYPQPISLSPGTSFSLPVTFRPLEKIEYSDVIEFTSKEGVFIVPVQAVLPKYCLKVTENVDYGLCAAHDVVHRTFTINNCSELVTSYTIGVVEPFSVETDEGTLEPFGSITITTLFKPKAASVFQGTIVVSYGEGFKRFVNVGLYGIGKYPHLMVTNLSTSNDPVQKSLPRPDNEKLLDFGFAAVGETVEHWIEVKNVSMVNAPFSISHPAGSKRVDCVFDCKQRRGIIPAQSCIRIPVTYCPNTVGIQSTDYFNIKAIGNISKTVIHCIGFSRGPRIFFSDTVLNFNVVNLGGAVKLPIELINDMDLDATFQIIIDCHESVFKFELVCGTIPAKCRKIIMVTFVPTKPINYYRKVICMVHNQGPLYLDLIGTCHTETVKPAVIETKHIYMYEVHRRRGLAVTAPEVLNEQLKEGQLQLDTEGFLYDPQISGQEKNGFTNTIPLIEQYFNDGYHYEIATQTPLVSLDTHLVNFGHCPTINDIRDQIVCITNHTNGKVTASWICGDNHVFTVTPPVQDILPQKCAAFKVSFRPNAPDLFFAAELECYVSYKSLRDFRLVQELTHFPPWCLTLSTFGLTFGRKAETFLPRFRLESSRIIFLPVLPTESTYRTALITNQSATPLYYNLQRDAKCAFWVKPAIGLIEPYRCHVVMFKHVPSKVKKYIFNMPMHVNYMDKNKQVIQLVGSAENPQVVLENKGNMYFKKTCVGLSSERLYKVKNITRLPVHYEWKMKYSDKLKLTVFPQIGVIQPNETQYHTWTFHPENAGKHIMKPCLQVRGYVPHEAHIHTDKDKHQPGPKKEMMLRVIGEGTKGEIMVENNYMDAGCIVIGTTSVEHMSLINNSDCDLFYLLHLEETMQGLLPSEDSRYDPICLGIGNKQGMIAARSKLIIRMTLSPTRRVFYQWSISCVLTDEHGIPKELVTTHLCYILANGVYPTIAVTDARAYGSAIGISKKQLWSLFNLDKLNVNLDSEPASAELMYSLQTRQSHNRRPPVYTRAIMDFNFSAASIHTGPSCVQLMLENTGNVTCTWAFLFPRDLELELEYWSETGEFSVEELNDMKVQDNNLFTIDPKQGKLNPSEVCGVTFTYKHDIAGTNRLPVLLKVAKGREILLNFVGVTVETDLPYVHFPLSKHTFAPVAIGSKNVATQLFEMYNAGGTLVRYEFDLSSLQTLTKENYGHVIFHVLNPKGEIAPGETGYIQWKFNPLEAKNYTVEVPIHIHNGDTEIIFFSAVGYDHRVMGNTLPNVDQPHELAGIPDVQSILIPGQLCLVSPERVNFGNVPMFTKNRRLTTLVNRSREHAVFFKWHITASKDSKMISVSPPEGTIAAGAGKLCRITFLSLGTPSFFDIDLICEVINLTDYKAFKLELQQWNAERVRQSQEFTITEDDLDADEHMLDLSSDHPPTRLESVSRRTSPDLDMITTEQQFIKYKTLPPIKRCTLKYSPTQKARGKQRFVENFWPCPQPPKPFLLHFGVTARSHILADFQQNFQGDLRGYFIDRLLSERQSKMESQHVIIPAKITNCLIREAELVQDVMKMILRGLIDDTEFQDSCVKVINDAIPYYQQYVSYSLPHRIPRIMSPPPSQSPVDPDVRQTTTSVTPPPYQHSDRSSSDKDPIKPMTSTPRMSGRQQSLGNSRDKETLLETEKFLQRKTIKKLPEFGNALDSIVENTILNLIQEAYHQEFSITARPRRIALPPRKKASPRNIAALKS